MNTSQNGANLVFSLGAVTGSTASAVVGEYKPISDFLPEAINNTLGWDND